MWSDGYRVLIWVHAQLALLHASAGGCVRGVSRTGGRRLCSSSWGWQSRLQLQRPRPHELSGAAACCKVLILVNSTHPQLLLLQLHLRGGSDLAAGSRMPSHWRARAIAHSLHTAGRTQLPDQHMAPRRYWLPTSLAVTPGWAGGLRGGSRTRCKACERLSSQQVRSLPQATRGQHPSAAKP